MRRRSQLQPIIVNRVPGVFGGISSRSERFPSATSETRLWGPQERGLQTRELAHED